MPRTTTKIRPKKAPPASAETKQPLAETTGYAVRDRVSHPKFGDGTVTAIDADKLTIKFKDGRVRQIIDYFVKRRDR